MILKNQRQGYLATIFYFHKLISQTDASQIVQVSVFYRGKTRWLYIMYIPSQ